MSGYAVIDFETTGVFTNDRAVEIAVVLTDSDGRSESEWTTLLNPGRDLGATHIHRIEARDVIDAPVFSDIAGHLIDLLRGRAIVAHNASFDMRFLRRELLKCQFDIPYVPALCTMRWAGRTWAAPAKMADLCEYLGIDLVEAHSALGDTRATSAVLAALIEEHRDSPAWAEEARLGATFSWPEIPVRAFTATPRGRGPRNPAAWLATTAESIYVPSDPPNEAAYLLELEAALLDRKVSIHEAKQLTMIAARESISVMRRVDLHQDYLTALARAAQADHNVTQSERADLERVAELLGLGPSSVVESLEVARLTTDENTESTSSSPAEGSSPVLLHPGDRVAFTGPTTTPRTEWSARVTAAGLTTGTVTKSTRFLVSADPDSLSGKAEKARSYGVTIIDEQTFVRLFSTYSASC